MASRSKAEGKEVPIGSLNWVPSTMGALPEVMPLCTPRDVTRKRTEPTIVTALPNGEPDRELERPDAEGRVVHSTLDPMQNGTHVHPAKGTAYPCGVLDPRLGKVDTVMG